MLFVNGAHPRWNACHLSISYGMGYLNFIHTICIMEQCPAPCACTLVWHWMIIWNKNTKLFIFCMINLYINQRCWKIFLKLLDQNYKNTNFFVSCMINIHKLTRDDWNLSKLLDLDQEYKNTIVFVFGMINSYLNQSWW